MDVTNYQDAMERAIALRLRAKKEIAEERRGALLRLAQQWEAWAEDCRVRAGRCEAIDVARQPAEDI